MKHTPNKVEMNVIEFIAEFCGVSIEEIDMDSALRDDLGVDGDDADNLLQEYSSRFDVDISGIDSRRYFSEERPLGLYSLIRMLIRLEFAEKRDLLMVSDLVAGVRNGRLSGFPKNGT